MVWPNSSLIRWAWMRTLTSSPPPAANGMTSVIGWVGQSCAKDAPASAITAVKAVDIVLRMLSLGYSAHSRDSRNRLVEVTGLVPERNYWFFPK